MKLYKLYLKKTPLKHYMDEVECYMVILYINIW